MAIEYLLAALRRRKDGGVYIQCEALSLSRDIPAGLGWALNPLVSGIPRESLVRVLGRTSVDRSGRDEICK